MTSPIRSACTLFAALIAATAFFASASSASAAFFCVGTSSCALGTMESTIQDAFADADGNGATDTIFVGPGGSPYAGPFNYTSAEPVNIIGSGSPRPVLQGAGGGLFVLRVANNSNSSISHLHIEVPNIDGGAALEWAGTASDMEITHTGTGKEIRALLPAGNSQLQNSTVTLQGGGFGKAVDATLTAALPVALQDVTIKGSTRVGIDASAPSLGLSLVRVMAEANRTPLTIGGSSTSVTGEQFVGRAKAMAVGDGVIYQLSGATTSISHATLYGDGVGRGVLVDATSDHSSLTLRNSVIANVASTGVMGGTGHTATFTLGYSSVPGASVANVGGVYTPQTGVSFTPVTFVDAAAGDYHLKAPQSAIDAADPSDLTTLDVESLPREVDGNGDGSAISDLGAFEYQRSAPVPKISGGGTAELFSTMSFGAGASTDPDAGDTLSFVWDFGDGNGATGVTTSHTFMNTGDFEVTLIATDQLGRSAQAKAFVRISDTSSPKLVIGKPKFNSRKSMLRVPISCPATELKCIVKFTYTARSKKGKKKRVVVGTAKPLTVDGGKTTTAIIKLRKSVLQRTLTNGRVSTRLTFEVSDPAGNKAKPESRTVIYKAKQGTTGKTK